MLVAHLHTGSLFEEYCALADYEADDESQVSFKSGDKVLVMSRDLTGILSLMQKRVGIGVGKGAAILPTIYRNCWHVPLLPIAS